MWFFWQCSPAVHFTCLFFWKFLFASHWTGVIFLTVFAAFHFTGLIFLTFFTSLSCEGECVVISLHKLTYELWTPLARTIGSSESEWEHCSKMCVCVLGLFQNVCLCDLDSFYQLFSSPVRFFWQFFTSLSCEGGCVVISLHKFTYALLTPLARTIGSGESEWEHCSKMCVCVMGLFRNVCLCDLVSFN